MKPSQIIQNTAFAILHYISLVYFSTLTTLTPTIIFMCFFCAWCPFPRMSATQAHSLPCAQCLKEGTTHSSSQVFVE